MYHIGLKKSFEGSAWYATGMCDIPFVVFHFSGFALATVIVDLIVDQVTHSNEMKSNNFISAELNLGYILKKHFNRPTLAKCGVPKFYKM